MHCLGDAGFFIDALSINGRAVYRESMAYAFRMHNATSSVNKECVATKADDLTWMCMFADYTLPHIRTPFFMVCQSNVHAERINMIRATPHIVCVDEAMPLLLYTHYTCSSERSDAAVDMVTVKFTLRLVVDGVDLGRASVLQPVTS